MSLPSFTDSQPALGQPVEELPTPAVVADLDVLDRNIETAQELAERHDVDVCSHTKAHKSPALARRQQRAFDGGLMCQKLSEAEVMVRYGLDDLLVVCPVVDERKLDLLCWIADRTKRFATTVDGPGNIDPLCDAAGRHDTTIDVILEVDTGLERMGVEPGIPAREMAKHVRTRPNVELGGILGHDSQVTYDAGTDSEFEAGCREVVEKLETTVDALADAGIDPGRVISGSTATAPYVADADVVTDIDPGRYVFNDVEMIEHAPTVSAEHCGMTVHTTVISRPTPERAIVDAGSKTVSFLGSPLPVPKNRGDIEFYSKSSEHGYVDVSDCEAPTEVGDRLEFIVPNLYGAVNLRETIPAVREGRIEELWHVAARGKDK